MAVELAFVGALLRVDIVCTRSENNRVVRCLDSCGSGERFVLGKRGLFFLSRDRVNQAVKSKAVASQERKKTVLVFPSYHFVCVCVESNQGLIRGFTRLLPLFFNYL